MKNAKVIKVSCCGANDLLKIEDIVAFLIKNPKAEIGVGVSANKCEQNTPRYVWLLNLIEIIKKFPYAGSIALHVNGSWAKQIVENGILPKTINEIINRLEKPIRMQLNVVGSGFTLEAINPQILANLISLTKDKIKFIVPFNIQSASYVKALSLITNNFDILYDASFGNGQKANKYFSLFPNQLQGYAGGLSAENIDEELIRINEITKKPTAIWVDAEGKLRKENQNTLDLNKAQNFVDSTFRNKQKNNQNTNNLF